MNGQESVLTRGAMSGPKGGLSFTLVKRRDIVFEYCENRRVWDEIKSAASEHFPCATHVACLCFASVFGLDQKEQDTTSSLLVSVVWLQTSCLGENSGCRRSFESFLIGGELWGGLVGLHQPHLLRMRRSVSDFGTSEQGMLV